MVGMIGIFGGTFDPIHYGHLRPVEEVMHALALEQVRFVLARQPPHRPPPVAATEQRLRMVELALAGKPGFCIDRRELERPGPSYTVDTLESLRVEFRLQPLCLIMGFDAFLGIETWDRWPRLLELTHIVAMHRPGSWDQSGLDHLPAWAQTRLCQDPAELMRKPAGLLSVQAVIPQPISASELRAAIAKGESVQDLVPATVWRYIRENKLYLD
jgi:nicotinate-nucleotide adenylyltransferase